MTTYEDLTPYAYFSADETEDTADTVLNVGWLGRESRFAIGEPAPGLAEALLLLAAFHSVHQTRGFHLCELCGPRSSPEDYDPVEMPFGLAARGAVTLGSAEIRVPGPDGVVYAAPDLIAHHVVAHGYQPPADFVRAAVAEAAARAEVWHRAQRDLPVGTAAKGVVRAQSVAGTEISLEGFPGLTAELGPDATGAPGPGTPVETVVIGQVDRNRTIVLRLG